MKIPNYPHPPLTLGENLVGLLLGPEAQEILI